MISIEDVIRRLAFPSFAGLTGESPSGGAGKRSSHAPPRRQAHQLYNSGCCQKDKHFRRRDHFGLLWKMLFVVSHHIGIFDRKTDFIKDLVCGIGMHFGRRRSSWIDAVCLEFCYDTRCDVRWDSQSGKSEDLFILLKDFFTYKGLYRAIKHERQDSGCGRIWFVSFSGGDQYISVNNCVYHFMVFFSFAYAWRSVHRSLHLSIRALLERKAAANAEERSARR